MFSLKPLEARVQSFSVLCIPAGGTHITSDMCAGIYISRGYTNHCDTASHVIAFSRVHSYQGFSSGWPAGSQVAIRIAEVALFADYTDRWFSLQNRRIFLRILGEQRRKRGERELRARRWLCSLFSQ